MFTEFGRQQNWVDVHNLRVIKYGSNLHFDCHLTVPYYFSIREGHDEIEKMESIINAHHESNDEWFVHADACVPPAMCKICMKSDCARREAAFVQKISWQLDNVIRNQKHNLPD